LRKQEEDALGRGSKREQDNGVENPKSSITRGGLGVPKTDDNSGKGSITRGGFGQTARDALKSKEDESGSGFYNPDADKPAPTRRQRIKKRLAVAAIVSGTIGGGSGLALLGIASGPFKFVHAG